MHDITISITTFGYLHGPAPAADLLLDLRHHFRDPHVAPELRCLTARDPAVRTAVRRTPGIAALVDATAAAVLAYLAGPSAGPLTLAVGCQGGRHRAAVTGDLLATTLTEVHGLDVSLTHRDLDKPVVTRTPTDTESGVPSHLRPWSVPFPAYAPVDITPPELQPGPGLDASVAAGWAEPHPDPAALPDLADRQAAAIVPFRLDDQGRPLHPAGRTGRTGRNLGKWGENAAVDPIVVAGTEPDHWRVLLIRRADCQDWAIPGGMVDPGESALAALARELREETGLDLDGLIPFILKRGLVADPRESDHAWVASTAALYRLPAPVAVTAADDATDAAWFPFTGLDALHAELDRVGGVLYRAHRPLLATALNRLADEHADG